MKTEEVSSDRGVVKFLTPESAEDQKKIDLMVGRGEVRMLEDWVEPEKETKDG